MLGEAQKVRSQDRGHDLRTLESALRGRGWRCRFGWEHEGTGHLGSDRMLRSGLLAVLGVKDY